MSDKSIIHPFDKSGILQLNISQPDNIENRNSEFESVLNHIKMFVKQKKDCSHPLGLRVKNNEDASHLLFSPAGQNFSQFAYVLTKQL